MDFASFYHTFTENSCSWLHLYKGSCLLQQDCDMNYITCLLSYYNSFLVKLQLETTVLFYLWVRSLILALYSVLRHLMFLVLHIFLIKISNIYIHYYQHGYFWTPYSIPEMSGPFEGDCESDDSVKELMYVPPSYDNPNQSDWSRWHHPTVI
jgi:hypothetical protein